MSRIIRLNTKFDELQSLITEYADIFDKKVVPVKNKVVTLHLKENAKPVFQRARVVPLALVPAVNKEIDRLVAEGLWVKVDYSEWASPIVPVLKSNGDVRLCGDYSGTLNDQLHVTQHPFPPPDEVLAHMAGEEFTTLDVRTAFYHMLADYASSLMMVLNTLRGLFRPTCIQFGVASASAEWQEFMDRIFRDLCMKVHDDLFMTGKNRKEHLDRLRKVFQVCREFGVRLNFEKCKFFEPKVTFLGYCVDKNGISKKPDKVAAILEASRPTTVTEVKSFTGMVNFYAKFCSQLASIAQPLYEATKGKTGKDAINWNSKCQVAFDAIKQEIASPNVLIHYSPKLPLVLSVDASPVGIGAVLSHQVGKDERPIVFASRVLSAAEKNYSQLDKEALAIKWGVEKFFYYLYGRHFTLITDHQPLVHIFSKTKKLPALSATRRLHYAIFLQNFDFDIKYRRSEDHGNADFLSRFPRNVKEAVELFDQSVNRIHQLIFQDCPLTVRELSNATTKDKDLLILLEKLRSGESCEDYSLHEGVIMKGVRIVIPEILQNRILAELHQGHFGVVKMKQLARTTVFWKKIDSDIEQMVRNCESCIAFRPEQTKTKTHFWEYPATPWERIHVDFAGPFQGQMFLLVVDAHSKWIEVEIVPTTSTKVVISVLQKLFSTFGIPKVIVSDNGTAFTSTEFDKFRTAYAIDHKTCAPFHAASNGQAERFVYTLKQSLRALKKESADTDSQAAVQERLNKFLFAYRRAPSIATGQSPAKLMLGRELRSLLTVFRPDLKSRVDKNRKQVSFNDPDYKVSEKVAVRDYSSRNQRWEVGTVINKDGVLNYTIQLPDSRLVRRHADQMRPVGNNVMMSTPSSVQQQIPPTMRISPKKSPSVTPMTPAKPATVQNQAEPAIEVVDASSTQPAKAASPIVGPIPVRRSERTRKVPDRLNL
ncbi:uncharacterized protein K02A2.6-like [Planococcus citri]|uniref:uncharacterized protein K02A2.6-like n=1 Tax=Planococcus citri TaxID=170843 RepID=UPI0031F89E6F